MVRLTDSKPWSTLPKGENDRPELHYIGDLPKNMEAVEVARIAARITGWKVYFMPDHPDHPPNRISCWTDRSFGNERPFWEAFENLMKAKYGELEALWPQSADPNEGPEPPASSKRYFFR